MSYKQFRLEEENSALVLQLLSEFNAFNAIGDANSQWIGLPFYGHTAQDHSIQFVNQIQRNFTATDTIAQYIVPLTCDKGSYSLKLKNLKVIMAAADANDYLDQVFFFGVQNDSTADQLYTDGTNRTAANTYTYDLSDIDCAGYWQIILRSDFVFTTQFQTAWWGFYLEYYYS